MKIELQKFERFITESIIEEMYDGVDPKEKFVSSALESIGETIDSVVEKISDHGLNARAVRGFFVDILYNLIFQKPIKNRAKMIEYSHALSLAKKIYEEIHKKLLSEVITSKNSTILEEFDYPSSSGGSSLGARMIRLLAVLGVNALNNTVVPMMKRTSELISKLSKDVQPAFVELQARALEAAEKYGPHILKATGVVGIALISAAANIEKMASIKIKKLKNALIASEIEKAEDSISSLSDDESEKEEIPSEAEQKLNNSIEELISWLSSNIVGLLSSDEDFMLAVKSYNPRTRWSGGNITIKEVSKIVDQLIKINLFKTKNTPRKIGLLDSPSTIDELMSLMSDFREIANGELEDTVSVKKVFAKLTEDLPRKASEEFYRANSSEFGFS